MSQYKYDEEGQQFTVFLLTFLLLILFPLTYNHLTNSNLLPSKPNQSFGWFHSKGNKVKELKNVTKRSITNPRLATSTYLLTLGWALVAYLLHKLSTTEASSTHAIYDPFAVLGIVASASEKEIKKHYKKLSIKFHPDKFSSASNQTREEAETHYIALTKAYKALTDETIRNNFEKYGHPDGRQEMSMGIALPRWVVESQNNIYVLGIYGLIFGIGAPYLVAKWWYGSRSVTKDGIINQTAFTFFQHLKEETPPARIIALLAVSEEFKDPKLDRKGLNKSEEKDLANMEKEVRKRLEPLGERFKLIETFRSQSIRKAIVLLYAYLLRVETPNKKLTKEKYLIAPRALSLLSGLLSISLAHNWLSLTKQLMSMHQSVFQAVPIGTPHPKISELMQLPNMNFSRSLALIKALPDLIGQYGIEGLYNAKDDERRKALAVGESVGMKEEEYKQILNVAAEWPRLELKDAFFKVSGERLVTAGAIVQFVVKLKLSPPGRNSGLLKDGVSPSLLSELSNSPSSVRPSTEEDEDVSLDSLIGRSSKSAEKTGKQLGSYVNAPYFILEKKPKWWVFIGDAKLNRVIVQPTEVGDVGNDLVRTFSVQFQAPTSPGLYTFQVHVKSLNYLGSDATMNVKLKVDDQDALDEDQQDQEDDISEPDEDSLAGQMALMKGGKVKPSTPRDEDDEEDDDSEEEEEDDDDSDSDSDSD